MTDPIRDTVDLLAEHEAAGGVDSEPTEITDQQDPSYVEPWMPATPVEPAENDEVPPADEDGEV